MTSMIGRLIDRVVNQMGIELWERANGRDSLLSTLSVVVKGKYQGLMFSDFVNPTPFRQLGRLILICSGRQPCGCVVVVQDLL